MGRIVKDATVARTQTRRLTAETSGSGGRRIVAIYLDGQYVDYLEEWLDHWYHKLHGNRPTADHEIIGSTPEEALDWWARSRGFTFLEEEAVLEVVVDKFNILRGHVWINKVTQMIVRIDPGQFSRHREYIGKEVEVVEKNYVGELPRVRFKRSLIGGCKEE